MNINSLRAYYNKETLGYKISVRNLLKKIFEQTNGSYTVKQLIYITGVKDRSLQPRISDLFKDGFIIESGTIKESKCDVSLYSINRHQELFNTKKKTKIDLLKLAVEKCTIAETRQAIFDEYKRLLNYQNGH